MNYQVLYGGGKKVWSEKCYLFKSMPTPQIAVTTQLPVVIMGEVHSSAAHVQIENGTLADLKGLGYDTVAMELPRDYQPAVSKYLKSKQAPKDNEEMEREIMAVDTHAPSAKSISKEELSGYMKMMHASFDNLSRALGTAQAAMKEGYQVQLVDVPSVRLAALAEGPRDQEVAERNKAMASEVAKEVQNGSNVVLIAGGLHLNPKMAGGSSLQGELKTLGIRSENFDLAVNGRSTDEATHVPAARVSTPDHLVSSSAQILSVMSRDLGAGMQRPALAAQVSTTRDSLQK